MSYAGYDFRTFSGFTATQKAFLAAHPVLAAYPPGSPEWNRFMANHTLISAAWSNLSQQRTATAPAPAPTAPPPSGAPASTAPTAPAFDQNAYDTLVAIFNSYGLGSLAPTLLGYVQRGITDSGTIEVLIRETPEYKTRFAANVQRQQAGLNALTIGEYLGLENSYAQILRGSGLPQGFYDSKDDFTNWIAGDVSPDEIRERVTMAQQATMSSDPNVRKALSDYYGLGDGDLVAYFLDPNRANTLFQTRHVYQTANIGAAAMDQGLSLAADRASLYADKGITTAQAAQGFGQVAQVLPDAEKLGNIYGDPFNQVDAENEFILGLASAQRKREKLAGKEVASFTGSGGLGRTALRTKTSGQY